MGSFRLAVRALFPISKATLSLSGITAMNTVMTNFLLSLLVFRSSEPKPQVEVFKKISGRVIDSVLKTADECKLTKKEKMDLEELAKAYKGLLEGV